MQVRARLQGLARFADQVVHYGRGQLLQQLLLGPEAVVEGAERRVGLGCYRPGRGRGHPVPGHDREGRLDQLLAAPSFEQAATLPVAGLTALRRCGPEGPYSAATF